MVIDSLRFLWLLVAVLIATISLWFGLHFYATNRGLSQYQTDLVRRISTQTPLKVSPLEMDSQQKPAFFAKAQYINWQWQWVSSDQEALSLRKAFNQWPQSLFFLEVQVDQTSDLKALKEDLAHNQNWQRAILMSPSDGVLRDLRELAPLWTFATGGVFVTKVLSFYSIGLGELFDIPGDILFLSKKARLSQQELNGLTEIAHKQKKLVLFEMTDSNLNTDQVDLVLSQD